MSGNNDIKLTVAIPTYNGAQYIRRTLDSIIVQLQCIDEKIEVIISDNASTDGTPEVIKEYQKKYSFIEYFRNDVNLGFDKNVDLLFKRAKGEYVWTLGDSEVLKPILNILVSDIGNNRYANILLNFEIYGEKERKIEVKDNFGIGENRVLHSHDEFFRTFKYGITPLSANIVLKELWLEVIENSLVTNGWCHVERIIAILSHFDNRGSLYFGKVSFTLFRGENGWWTKDGMLFINTLSLRKIVKNMRNGDYHKETVKLLLSEADKTFLETIKQSKLNGLKLTPSLLLKCLKVQDNRWVFFLQYLPLLIIPSSLYKVKKAIKRIFLKIAGIRDQL